MIQWVYERAIRAELLDRVVVATDHEQILTVVQEFGGEGMMTSELHESGTDRIAEVATQIPADFVVNIQGDEPLIEPAVIDQALRPLMDEPHIDMGTLATTMDPETADNPNIVKVVFNEQGRALYFSRSKIPYFRHNTSEQKQFPYWQHIGLYVYRGQFLTQFTNYPVSPLEKIEQLEQLRALEHGAYIHVEITDYPSISVDTPDDLARVRQTLQTTGQV